MVFDFYFRALLRLRAVGNFPVMANASTFHLVLPVETDESREVRAHPRRRSWPTRNPAVEITSA
jgi:hypothetical protein